MSTLPAIPEAVLKVTQNHPDNAIEKAKRYDQDIEVLKDYILDLRTELENTYGKLDNLKSADAYFETLRKIQGILNEDVGFPMPCPRG